MARATVSMQKVKGSNPIGPMDEKLSVHQAVSDTGKFIGGYQGRLGLTSQKSQGTVSLKQLASPQRCKTRIQFILHVLYYKVYNSSCSRVGHDLIDCVKSSPEQIKITASICKHLLCDDESAACSGIDASMQPTWSYQIVSYLTAVRVVYLVIYNITG